MASAVSSATTRSSNGLDLDIAAGEFIALIGRSGSGKSTLLRALAGLDPEVNGDLAVDGEVGHRLPGTSAAAMEDWSSENVGARHAPRSTPRRPATGIALDEVGLTVAQRGPGHSRCPAARRNAHHWRWALVPPSAPAAARRTVLGAGCLDPHHDPPAGA